MKQGTAINAPKKGRFATILVVSALLLAPVVVPAFAAKIDPQSLATPSWMERFTPSGVDSRLAAKMQRNAMRSNQAFPFTPAGAGGKRDGTMTVAARTNSLLATNAVSVRSAMANIDAGRGGTVRLNNSDYRLSSARGWQGFTLPANAITVEQPRLDTIVGNGSFRLDGNDTKKKPSRFNADMSVAKVGKAANPRGNAAAGDYALDVAGSFSLSKRIDLTAGVRYSSERDRVLPAADSRADSEAVYVGTKIRF
jgi:hypothetical protein